MSVPSLDQAKELLQAAANEQAYWDEHYDYVLNHYRDRFVAVQHGEVVGAERDLPELILALTAQHIDIRDTWVRYVTEDHSKLLL